MDKKNKRILWIFNHTSLRDFELPLLISLGYEIYTPKHFTVEAGDRSASVTYEYDSTLSIPKDIIEYLNDVDFYAELSLETIEILNKYFGISFIMFLRETLKSFVYGFKGCIVLHVFGLSDGESYTDIMNHILGEGFLKHIRLLGRRFWFSTTYRNLSEIESDVLKCRTIYMPIGLSSEIEDKWKGGDKRFLFISPKINSNPYYHNIYTSFKNSFGDLQHIIGGGQLIPVPTDRNVTGFLPREEYDKLMESVSAMFYHSTNKRHLHYHPLEAIQRGIPLIFMAGGMLDYLGGSTLPGRCKTYREARRKLIRLSKGDRLFANKIRKTQKALLNEFKHEYCDPYWLKSMQEIERSIPKEIKRKIKLGVLLPAAYIGGILDYSIRFSMVIDYYCKKNNDDVQVVFLFPDDMVYADKLDRLHEKQIECRPYYASSKSIEWINLAHEFGGFVSDSNFYGNDTIFDVYRDGISDFNDLDYCFIMADLGYYGNEIYMQCPYSIVVHDYIQRYVPNMFGLNIKKNKLNNQFRADYVITTSKPTYEDALGYAGLCPNRVVLTPNLYDIGLYESEEKENNNEFKSYFIWSTNTSCHKNHLFALRALSTYYKNGGQLRCYITGVNTELFDISNKIDDSCSEYICKVREMISKDRLLKKNITVKGNMDKKDYFSLVNSAQFMFHPGYADNGNYSVTDAAIRGVPSLSSDYPAMRYMCDFMEIPCLFFELNNMNDLVEKLFDIENNCDKYSNRIPSVDMLKKHDYILEGKQLYNKVKEILKIV